MLTILFAKGIFAFERYAFIEEKIGRYFIPWGMFFINFTLAGANYKKASRGSLCLPSQA
jgi:hypothetical protein